jgi:hypothetical protein
VKRKTLKKRLKEATTVAAKWRILVDDPTPIEMLAIGAECLRPPSNHGEKWQREAWERLKQQFADLMFPALKEGKPEKFEELIQAMRDARQQMLIGWGNHRGRTEAQKRARKIRLAFLTAPNEVRTSVKTLCDHVSESLKLERGIDERHGRRIMKELRPDK